MDKLDVSILQILQENARVSLKDISKQISLSIPATSERLRKLEREGYIDNYTAVLNTEKFEREFICFCMVTLSSHTLEYDIAFRKFAEATPDILECHRVTGEYEYILKIITKSSRTMEDLLQKMRAEANVVNTSTFTVLTTSKELCSLPASLLVK